MRSLSTAQHLHSAISNCQEVPKSSWVRDTILSRFEAILNCTGRSKHGSHQDLRLKTVFYSSQTLFSPGLNAAWWKQGIQPKGLFKCFHFMWLGIVTFSRGSNKLCKIVKPKQHSSFKVSKLRKMVVGLETWERCAVVISWSKNKIPMAFLQKHGVVTY